MWKATELRQFLLYGVPVVLFNISNKIYRHFMPLSVSVRILLSPDLCIKNCDYADDMLKLFVKEFGSFCGMKYVG